MVADTTGMWIRHNGLLPSAGVILDHSAAAGADLHALGLALLNERTDPHQPLPILGDVVIDISRPTSATINDGASPADHGQRLWTGEFEDHHPASWLEAIASQGHCLVAVANCRALLTAGTPQAMADAFNDAWMGLIGIATYAYPDGIGYFPNDTSEEQ